MTTDWKKRLRQREAAIRRAEEARRQDIAAARLDGHSFREIGTWAGVNHERARQMCIDINGDSHTRAEQDAEPEPPDA
ncbi:hypothetical protein AB0F24_17570 [Streptomyces platensis]|uniref:hypothetical protein n=1 Tax=Streptomyces platensis TaxID=58346 RepID=UPI0033CDD433